MPNVPSSDKTTDHENKTKADKNRQKKKTKASSTDLQPQQQKTSSADRKTQEEKKKKGKRSSRLERRYGRFHCKKCNRGWESSHVYVVAGTLQVGCQLVHILCRLAVIGGDRRVEIPAL